MLFFAQKVPSIIGPSVRVNHVFQLITASFEVPGSDGSDTVTVTAPRANSGSSQISLRLMSRELRQGQVK